MIKTENSCKEIFLNATVLNDLQIQHEGAQYKTIHERCTEENICYDTKSFTNLHAGRKEAKIREPFAFREL
jgi:hypothetical protein